MPLARNLGRPRRIIYIVIGIAVIIYGLVMRELLPGLVVATLFVIGVILIWSPWLRH
jgi:hypothetical protein